MTSRRSMKAIRARESRAFQFIPGHVGGRVASAQPVRRLGGISAQVDPEDVVIANPNLWWKFDETSGTAAAEEYQTGTTMTFDGAVTWVAGGVEIPDGVAGEASSPTGYGMVSTGITYNGASAQGVAVEFYVDGLQNNSEVPVYLLQVYATAYAYGFYVTSESGGLGFETEAGSLHTEDSVDAAGPDGTRVLVRWEFSEDADTTRITLDGVQIYAGALAFPFDGSEEFVVVVAGADNDTRYDELKIWCGLQVVAIT